MTFNQTIEYLYSMLPVFHREGKKAYKADLSNTIALCEHLNNPQKQWRSVHVAGTNGKGSTSHMLAAVLQCAGYKTGLYTSPHLKSFTERIRVDGIPAPEKFVIDFVELHRALIESIKPSFFELSVAMAFDYFAQQCVDVAVVEVGLGGRLDSTNVITPDLSVITNIGWDHADILGDTLPKIASEKAGIIKSEIPIVVSERQEGIDIVFEQKAQIEGSKIFFASDAWRVAELAEDGRVVVYPTLEGAALEFRPQLTGYYQHKNLLGVIESVVQLRQMGYNISEWALSQGINQTASLTGLKGRWQVLSASTPFVVCDTAHNEPGLVDALRQFGALPHRQKVFVIGFVKDKDMGKILPLFPADAVYYFCQPSTPRKLLVNELAAQAEQFGLSGKCFEDVNEALQYAISYHPDAAIYVGGSTFVVADITNL